MDSLFYSNKIDAGLVTFDEEESRHLAGVLRRKTGDKLWITDGKGQIMEAEIAEIGKKQVLARVLSTKSVPPPTSSMLHLAIAPTKNMDRLEWMLEKSTEIGIGQITPIFCQRSERETLRLDRLEKIVVAAMKQSLQAWLPRLNAPMKAAELLQKATEPQKRICWCAPTPLPLLKDHLDVAQNTLVLIGPEGDFSAAEIALARQNGFLEVGLGPNRLRTETAGLYVVHAWSLVQ
jgi:16S rRNA (uracil1498-N3)-methyltransferase